MRKSITLFFEMILILSMSSCNKYESIFKSYSRSYLEPLDKSTVLGKEYDELKAIGAVATMEHVLWNDILAETYGENVPDGEHGFVINDSHLLRDYTAPDGTTFKWPKIDFNKYSLVLGEWFDGGDFHFLKEHKAKVDKDGHVEIFLHIMRHDGAAPGWARMDRWVAIYPKLPSGPAKVTRWDDATIYHVEYPQ